MLEMPPKIQQEPNGHSAVTPESGLGFALTPFLTSSGAACAIHSMLHASCFIYSIPQGHGPDQRFITQPFRYLPTLVASPFLDTYAT
ncbi:hypothetical protein BT96DRAFT_195694 [Gymnopus androsaceus JB14]|uniref:Uncharacterized protein n=1 Tax=Gymnopus androsaceus JB14 TaxID=1447944 RepID=A0A6A4H913_9AGAR|nr:hypothetical protein BT96DRAFT_195694 [Gymnopus androsaceus JB14]